MRQFELVGYKGVSIPVKVILLFNHNEFLTDKELVSIPVKVILLF